LNLSDFSANRPQHLSDLSVVATQPAHRPALGPADCCAPGTGKVVNLHSRQRAKLWQLPAHLHCSVIGTCLGTAELRKAVVRCRGDGFTRASELEVHEEGVRLAVQAEAGGKVLHRLLDQRHHTTIQRFEKAKIPADLASLWEEAKKSGEIPGAYWALLTHRGVSHELIQRAFGDVHMLSHLVGAANRADIRRLAAAEVQNAQLVEKVDRQQTQLRDAITARDATIKRLEQQLAARIAQAHAEQIEEAATEQDELHALRALVASLQRQLAHSTANAERARKRSEELSATLSRAQEELRRAGEQGAALRSELDAAEAQFVQRQPLDSDKQGSLDEALNGRKIVYVGGRPGTTHAIRALVEAAHGEFICHDGGLEERKGLLASAISGADLVLFPVDCISHDAAGKVKRLCRQSGRPYRALRTSSVASFVAALVAEGEDTAPHVVMARGAPAHASVSRFCLRHG
jgi:Uncharacterized protein conserved in bacteria (DUF2325)